MPIDPPRGRELLRYCELIRVLMAGVLAMMVAVCCGCVSPSLLSAGSRPECGSCLKKLESPVNNPVLGTASKTSPDLISIAQEDAQANTPVRTTDSPQHHQREKYFRPPDHDRSALQQAEQIPKPDSDAKALGESALALTSVVASIHSTFPLLEAAYEQRGIAVGSQIAAWGAFDTKLKAATENQPLGYYETYRHAGGISRPLYGGGELFGGYRIGRGDFEPWYLERQTNEGGEFKAGFRVPLIRDRDIDARRAELWRANFDRMRAEPDIRAQLIQYVRDGSVAYWYWVAAGQYYDIGNRALKLAHQRNDQLKRKVEVGEVDPPVMQDSLRSIAQREAKLIDLRRKLQQAAIKLSLFYRSPDGAPLVPDEDQLPGFPDPIALQTEHLDKDITTALELRPELAELELLARRMEIDLSEARNDMLPAVDAQLAGSQDVGAPTSPKRDKSQFEMEAGLYLDAPLQRRKAQGKLQAARSKLIQLSAKRQFTEDKIVAEIQSAFAALEAAYERLAKARESVRLAEYMADVERRKFDLGESDLLAVVLREQSAIEAAESKTDALLEYFTAAADYDAALAQDWPTRR